MTNGILAFINRKRFWNCDTLKEKQTDPQSRGQEPGVRMQNLRSTGRTRKGSVNEIVIFPEKGLGIVTL
jgi:hypothetical protein